MNARWVVAVVCIASVSVRLCAALPQSQDWHARASPAPFNHLRAVAAGPQAIVAVGDHGSIVRSPDGENWTRASFPWDVEFHAVAYGNGMFLAAGRTGTLATASADGLNWSRWILGSGNSERILYGLAFGAGRFVAVGSLSSDAYPYVLTSTDGRLWESSSRPTQNTLRAVAYANHTFVAVGDQGTIITSPDAFTWALRPSGTTVTLRAVTPFGARFIAAGDSGVVVTSGDGVSWSAAAPLAYGGVGLAASRGALVAVETNDFGNGVVQASPDGLNWPANFMVSSVSFNAIAADRYGEFVVVGNNGWIFQSETSAMDVVNSWTKPSSGDWQEAFWSRGRLPSNQDDLIAITNAGYKAVAIQSSTTANYPAALTPKDFLIDAPENSHNLLLLNYAGLTVPFAPSGELAVATNGSLLSYYSAVGADSLSVQGDATFAELAASRFGAVSVTNGGRLLLSNAWLSSGNAEVSGVLSRWDHEAGTHEVAGNLLIGPNGEYRLNNGTVSVNGWLQVQAGGEHGVAQFIVSGGAATFGTLALGAVRYTNSEMRGEFILNAGQLSAATTFISNGRFLQTGGTNRSYSFEMPLRGAEGSAAYDLYGGRLESGRIQLFADGFGQFYQNGGVHANSIEMNLYGSPERTLQYEAVYKLVSGSLYSPRIFLGGASFSQTGGTNQAGELSLNWFGQYYLLPGSRLSVNHTIIRDAQAPYMGPSFVHAGGEHIADVLTIENGGSYELQGGALSATSVIMGPNSTLSLGNGVVQANSDIYLRGGRVFPGQPSQQFGRLRVAADSFIDFAHGPGSIGFSDISWDVPVGLWIKNWKGPASSSTRDHLYIGRSISGGLIMFIFPSGYPQAYYPGYRRPDGEIIPLEPARISYRHAVNGLVLTWPEGYQLFQSLEVTGPYYPISYAASPWETTCVGSKRFFILRPPSN